MTAEAPPRDDIDWSLWEEQVEDDVPCDHCSEPAAWRCTTKPCGCVGLLCDRHMKYNDWALNQWPRSRCYWQCSKCKASAEALDKKPL